MSILLLTAIGAKLIGFYGGLQFDKKKVCQVTGSVESPLCEKYCAPVPFRPTKVAVTPSYSGMSKMVL